MYKGVIFIQGINIGQARFLTSGGQKYRSMDVHLLFPRLYINK